MVLWHWSFGKYWFNESCRLLFYWHILFYSNPKSHSLISPLSSSEKALSTRKLSIARWQTSFQNSNVHLKAQFYYWQQMLPVVFLQVTGSFSRPNTQVRWLFVQEKSQHQLVQFSTQTTEQVPFFKRPYSAEVLYMHLLFCHPDC